MNTLLKILSAVGLLLSILPAFLVFTGALTFEQYTLLLMIGTLLWFLTAPSWINKKQEA